MPRPLVFFGLSNKELSFLFDIIYTDSSIMKLLREKSCHSINNRIIRFILILAGLVTFSLGIVGIFIPLLPTTPFLLLSALCFLRSSERLYRWLTGHRIFGKYIKYYLEYRAITARIKIIALIFLWGVMTTSIVFFAEKWWLRLLLIAIAGGVTVHIVTMKTLTKEMLNSRKEPEEGRRESAV